MSVMDEQGYKRTYHECERVKANVPRRVVADRSTINLYMEALKYNWPVSPESRARCLSATLDIAENPEVDEKTRISAISCVVKMDQVNIMALQAAMKAKALSEGLDQPTIQIALKAALEDNGEE